MDRLGAAIEDVTSASYGLGVATGHASVAGGVPCRLPVSAFVLAQHCETVYDVLEFADALLQWALGALEAERDSAKDGV